MTSNWGENSISILQFQKLRSLLRAPHVFLLVISEVAFSSHSSQQYIISPFIPLSLILSCHCDAPPSPPTLELTLPLFFFHDFLYEASIHVPKTRYSAGCWLLDYPSALLFVPIHPFHLPLPSTHSYYPLHHSKPPLASFLLLLRFCCHRILRGRSLRCSRSPPLPRSSSLPAACQSRLRSRGR